MTIGEPPDGRADPGDPVPGAPVPPPGAPLPARAETSAPALPVVAVYPQDSHAHVQAGAPIPNQSAAPPSIQATAPVQSIPTIQASAPVLATAPAAPTAPPTAPAMPAPPRPAPLTSPAPATTAPAPVTASAPVPPRAAAATGTVYGAAQPPSPYAQPGAGLSYQVYPVMWVPPPPRRSRVLPWLLGTLTVVTVLALVALGGYVALTQYGGPAAGATWRAAVSPTDVLPEHNAPASEWANWARRAVNELVDAQARALLDGDEAGFLAAVDQANQQLIDDHRRRFEVLRALGPGVWTENVSGAPKATGERSWTADLRISYCFGESTCQAVQLVVSSDWELREDRLVMVGLTPSDSSEIGPRPWETDDLAVKTGERVVIATQKAHAWRLTDAVKAGDRAAAVADRLSVWSDPPSRYVIFLAGAGDWNRWYGHEQPDWAAAWAVPVSPTVTEVVIRTQVVQQRGLEPLLTHELTHVTTLAGERDGAGRSSWWLVEGIADYATMVGRSVRTYDALVPTRTFVRGDWNGDPTVDPPLSTASLDEASARYGIAFLAVRYIADTYTEEKMLDFFGRVVHDNDSLETASTAALGIEWATVKAAAEQFIRASVR